MEHETKNPLGSTYLFKRTPTDEEIANHLELGTIKIRFFKVSTKKVVDEVMITEPFYIRGYVWTGEYLKNGKMKFVENRMLSKIIFSKIVDKHGLNYFFNYGKEESNKIRAVIDSICTFNGHCEESEHFKVDFEAYRNCNTLLPLTSHQPDDEKERRWKYLKAVKDAGYLKRIPLDLMSTRQTSFYRAGWSERFKFRTGKESRLGKYAFDYILYMYRNMKRERFSPEDVACIKGSMISDILSNMRNTRIVPIGKGSFDGYTDPREGQITVNKYLSNVNRDWGYVAQLSEKQLADPEVVRQLYLFNQDIPGNLFPRFFSDSAHFMSEVVHHFQDGAFLQSVSPFFSNDKELVMSMIDLTSKRDEYGDSWNRASLKIYSLLNTKLKTDSDVIRKVGGNCFRYMPTQKLKDRQFLLEILKLWPSSYTQDLEILLKFVNVNLLHDIEFLKCAFMTKHDETVIEYWLDHNGKKRLGQELLSEFKHHMTIAKNEFDDFTLKITLDLLDKVLERRKLRDGLELSLQYKHEPSTQRKTKI